MIIDRTVSRTVTTYSYMQMLSATLGFPYAVAMETGFMPIYLFIQIYAYCTHPQTSKHSQYMLNCRSQEYCTSF